ncbi:hypothetical protein FACUT_758 [Fusarium acutatum]|uniref:Uncharacterized protein n=1 Tax=Fusarium acutatum TaxID=78861 RepID=A0A8H4NQV8_9HYPO|nr:hypothetical protein FACUT_758 [Fusarium acutatum]
MPIIVLLYDLHGCMALAVSLDLLRIAVKVSSASALILLPSQTYLLTHYHSSETMCFLVVTTTYCRRCGKSLGVEQSHRKCDLRRGPGGPFHPTPDVENNTKYRHWVDCESCQYGYEMYRHARDNNISYPTPNPPFN